MKKGNSLVERKDGIFSRIIAKIKMFIFKNTKTGKAKDNDAKKATEISTPKEEMKNINPLEDMEILKKVMNNEIQIEDLDDDTKIRLIVLCKKREAKIKKKIEETEEKIRRVDSLMGKIS